MGLALAFRPSKSSFDAPSEPAQNPDPKNFKILREASVGSYLIVKLNYPGCTNYEGNKILVYFKVSLEKLLTQKQIDPHFSKSRKFKSPIARFVPSEKGWRMAVSFCAAMEGVDPPSPE